MSQAAARCHAGEVRRRRSEYDASPTCTAALLLRCTQAARERMGAPPFALSCGAEGVCAHLEPASMFSPGDAAPFCSCARQNTSVKGSSFHAAEGPVHVGKGM